MIPFYVTVNKSKVVTVTMEAGDESGQEDNNSRAGLDPESETARTQNTDTRDTVDMGTHDTSGHPCHWPLGWASLYKSP